jgi:polyhydroxyalkanoate synthesis repressor PhaR
MTTEKPPITIKKYANRRLYNTGTSAYVTLEDLAQMVKIGEDFLVYDAKTSEDITRSVLTQIIFEQEGKDGQSLLPVTFLRQLIRFYGDSMQMLVPSYLEFSMGRLANEQQKFRDQMTTAFGVPGLPGFGMKPLTTESFAPIDEMARKNMAVFSQALNIFNPFGALTGNGAEGASPAAKPAETPDELGQLKSQMAEMQAKLEKLAK